MFVHFYGSIDPTTFELHKTLVYISFAISATNRLKIGRALEVANTDRMSVRVQTAYLRVAAKYFTARILNKSQNKNIFFDNLIFNLI